MAPQTKRKKDINQGKMPQIEAVNGVPIEQIRAQQAQGINVPGVVSREESGNRIQEREKLRAQGASPEQAQEIIASRREGAFLQTAEGIRAMQAQQEAIKAKNQNAQLNARFSADPTLQQDLATIGQVTQPIQATTGGQIPAPEIPDAITGLAGGAGAVAGVGAVAGAVATAPFVAVAGLGAGVAILGKMAVDQAQKVKEYNRITQNAPDNLNALIETANKGGDRQDLIRKWNAEKTKILINQANLKAEQEGALTRPLGRPGEELIEVTDFIDNQLPNLEADFYNSFLQPNPTRTFSYNSPDLQNQ